MAKLTGFGDLFNVWVEKKDQSVLVTQIFCKYLLSLYYKYGASQVALVVKNPTANARNVRDPGSMPGLGRSPEGRHGNPLQYSCLENPIHRGGWWGTVRKVAKSQTRLNQLSTAQHILDILFHDARHIAKSWTRLRNFTFTFHFHALEKEMATHSSVLAWRIPGMEEPGGLPSMGSHRVEHD